MDREEGTKEEMQMQRRVLQLNVERMYFDEIASGEKTEEYRKRKAHWKTRLEGREYDVIRFRNGYGARVPEMDVEWKGVRKTVRKGDPVYAIQLGKVLSVKRWRSGS